MEDYKKFVDFNLSRLKRTKDVDENKPKSPSLICFHGRPILPPLLSGAQREEMGKLKETAQKAAERNRKHKDDTRMSYVQTILHSVHIRKTPTLEELLKESDFGTRASPSDSISGSLSQNIFTKKYLHVQESLHPLTSTTCSDLLTSHLPPQTRYNEIRHNFPQDSETALDLHSSKTYFHQLYSCYDSYTNVENTIMAIGSQKEDIFCSGEDSVEGFLVHNSSDTVKKMPDIINYPPVDGEDLERSGQESSFGIDLKAENPQSSSINPSSAEESCDVYPVQTETSHLATQNDNDQEVELKEDLTGPLKDPPALTYLTEIHSQLSKTMQTDEEDSAPSEEPYRMSLQALLKKSQEYRRRQRMLRSQAKSAKIQHRTQDQPKSEEQSLSDKENDEQHTKVTEPRKGQERNDSHSSIVDQSLKRSCESDRKTDIFDESHLTIDNPAQTYVINPNSESYDSIRVHNWVNTSGNRNVSLPMPVWTENMSKSSECSANTSPLAFNDIKKYQNIPVLNFCRSPVPCKAKSPSAPFDKITQKEPVINTSINNDQVEGSKNRTSPVSVIESDVTSVLAKSSQHIDQLEFNLSGLKVLISDLECTLTENVDKSNSQSESQQTQISQNDSVCWSGDASLSQRSLSPDSLKRSNDKTSLIETETVNSQQHVMAMTTSREKDHTRVTASKCQNIRRLPSAKGTLTTAQRMCIPDIFRTCLPEATIRNNVSVLSDTSNHSVKIYSDLGRNSHCTSLNQSYDVDTPSELWLHSVYESQRREKKYMTPKCGVEGQGVGSKVKRRLQMTEVVQEREAAASRASSSTPKAAARWHEGLGSVKERQEQLRQIHAAQIRELQEEHQRQQQQLLQTLAERYHLLQIMSLPCSVSTSRLGDTVTFPTLSQPSSIPLPDHYRHLLSAAAKGFLTRRLLRTERVVQLVRTARDTHQFLQAFQKHSPNKGLPSRQDLMLQERVTLQLHAARFEIHNIFFSLTTRERMQLISSDRDLARERELKRQNGPGGQHRGKSLLSAATQKSLERKRGLMIQKKTAERHRGVSMRSRHKPGFTAQQPLETQAGQYRANPQRVPKSTYTSRPQ
ncbi:hypothetical protein NL108_003692 [Boleophthalmus pectinirostris]|uniref:centriolar coiled-coil protein of 110 kDa n=1 Tax=Boleophthalmus pectinirostris TaxID=150288 RepID=UPI00242DCC5B|nr:centriolar coiled-coil protein of 110 kDa [Boleophthalmus pectinirostris]KAJ0044274.1 hypothetical protein NL108_003692 [Boleophthalmus pectinirostris]